MLECTIFERNQELPVNRCTQIRIWKGRQCSLQKRRLKDQEEEIRPDPILLDDLIGGRIVNPADVGIFTSIPREGQIETRSGRNFATPGRQ